MVNGECHIKLNAKMILFFFVIFFCCKIFILKDDLHCFFISQMHPYLKG